MPINTEADTKTLRSRCQHMIDQMNRDAILRQGSPADDLMAFVLAERSRTADDSFAEALPLCLYFTTAEDSEEFITVFHRAKPNVITKRLP